MVAKKRYIRRSSANTQSKNDTKLERRPHDRINSYLMTFSTIGLLAAAAGQIIVSVRQMQLTEATTLLQLAESKPRLRVIPSKEEKVIGSSELGEGITLPVLFSVNTVRGIDSIFTIDVPITLHVSDDDGSSSCYIEVRGLYVQNDLIDTIDLFSPPQEDLSELVKALNSRGIEYGYPQWDFIVSYEDIYGELIWDRYDAAMRSGMASSRNKLILYNGIWSNGEGFYFDEGSTPEVHCPSMSKKIREALTELGGHPGNI